MQKKSINRYQRKFMLLIFLLLSGLFSFSQKIEPVNEGNSSLPRIITPINETKDSTGKKIYNPGKAALLSTILPGLGQIYNKKYWKLPLVYAAMGITGGIFIYNLNNYKDTRFAYKVKYNMRVNHIDSALFIKIKDELKPLSEESLRVYRNRFRRDIDYSVIFFAVMWGLNVVDATVDAHLKGFDVSPNLGLHLRAGYSDMAGTNGLSLVLSLH